MKDGKVSSCCKDCSERKVGCHGSCEQYKAFSEALRVWKNRNRMMDTVEAVIWKEHR